MKSNNLFELIRSLTKHEKGYFRKFSRIYSTEGDKNYIELFDFIDKMDVYDEKAIKAEFKRTKWISHLPVLKKYLFTQILKSLELYQRAGKKDDKSIFRQVDILISRGIYKEAADLLRDGQEIAAEAENHYSLLSSYDRERMLVGFMYPPSQQAAQLDRIRRQQENAMAAIKGIMDIKTVSDKLRETYTGKGVIRDEKLMAEIDEYVEINLLPALKLHPSLIYRNVALSSITYYAIMKGDNNAVLKYTKEHLQLAIRHQAFFANKYMHLLSIYSNYLTACIQSSLFKEFDAKIKAFEAINIHSGLSGEAYKFRLVFQLYFDYIVARKAYPLLFHHLKKFEKEYKVYGPLMNDQEKANLTSKLAYLLFLNGKIEEAADWIKIAMSLNSDDLADSLKVSIRVLDMILHYELKSFRLLDSKLLSAKRYLNKKSIFLQSEQSIISHLRQLIRAQNRTEETAIFRKFHKSLREIYDEHRTERPLIDDLNLFLWIENKVKRA
jgi:hypothetical protein